MLGFQYSEHQERRPRPGILSTIRVPAKMLCKRAPSDKYPSPAASVHPLVLGNRPPIAESHRVFSCGTCGKEVRICCRCDRGQRYCSKECSRVARRKSVRKAVRRYRKTAQGRRNHARCQKRWHLRWATTVVHQASSPTPPVAKASPVRATRASPPWAAELEPLFRCHFCGGPCGPVVPREPLWPFRRRD